MNWLDEMDKLSYGMFRALFCRMARIGVKRGIFTQEEAVRLVKRVTWQHPNREALKGR